MAKPVTATELIKRLNTDPDYLKMRREKDALQKAKSASIRSEQTALLADLKSVGWVVKSVWDLVNTSARYEDAVAVLLKHLQRPYSDRVKEGIARALAVPDAAWAWSFLLAEYKEAPEESGFKDGLAVALAATSSDEVIGQLVDIAKDPANGGSRLLLLRVLKKSKSPVAKDALADLKHDPALAKEIASWRSRKRKRPLAS